ncbi:hypothetical protein HanHA300_Chr01g0032501 [Helianthus annuus]|nr:hypothetical protein HanHA300_Chr01g0032501 [Helianthus annuus]
MFVLHMKRVGAKGNFAYKGLQNIQCSCFRGNPATCILESSNGSGASKQRKIIVYGVFLKTCWRI